MPKCRYCGDICDCGKDCQADVCPKCAKEITIKVRSGEAVVILDKLADTGKGIDNKTVCEVYKKVADKVLDMHQIKPPYKCECTEPDHSNLFVAGFEKCNRCKRLIDIPAPENTGEEQDDELETNEG